MRSAFLSVDEFAAELGVSTKTIRRRISNGDLYVSQTGGKHHVIRIPRGELERLKTGAQPDGCAPVLRGDDGDDEEQIKQPLSGPKPAWQRRRGSAW